MNTFTDIRIVGLDTEATEQSATASGRRLMYLTLSEQPSSVWRDIFDAERQFPRHSMWRHAWIEGDSIVVDCVPEELEQYHLRDLKQDVANTNKKVRAYLEQEERRAKAAHDAAQRERDRIEQLKKRLDFE
jgi:KaiC/GvpD/RAD55 family RecA-like ATPase